MLEEDGLLTIHLVRHGETLATREHRLCGQSDCALSERGRRQSAAIVESCAAGGDWRAVYTTPLSRCRSMAEAVAERLGIPLSVEHDLLEIDHGEWDGRLEVEIKESEPCFAEKLETPTARTLPARTSLAISRICAGIEERLPGECTWKRSMG